MMPTRHSHTLLAGLLGLAVFIAACDKGPAPSLFDPDATFDPDPVIESVEPEGSSLAGIGEIVIRGQNFSSNPNEVFVYFSGTPATVLEASPTQLTVRPPNVPATNMKITVSVLGAVNFSNAITYDLQPAAETFGNLADFEEPFGITTDAENNLYISMFSSSVSAGIKKITPEGVRSHYVDSPTKWDALGFGPDGSLYGVRGVRAVFRFPPGGGAQQTYAAVSNTRARLVAIEVDDEGNIWTGGSGGDIYRIASDKSIEAFPFEGSVQALKLFGEHLYAAVTRDTESSVWRFPVTGGTLGAGEVYFPLSERVPGAEALSLAFAATGELFVGTDAPDPVILVSPAGTGEVLYPGILQPDVVSMAWGPDPYLYVAQRGASPETSTIRRLNTQREGAR